MTNFNWDRVCAIDTAYLSPQDLEELLKIRSPAYDSLPWLGSEGFWGLFFITRSQEIIPIRVPKRVTGMFIGGGNPRCVSRAKAKLGFGRLGTLFEE